MTVLTGAQIIVPNAVSVSGAPKISNDTIDVAMATLSSYVFAYIRAKRWTSPAGSGLVDRTGNPIKTENTGQTYNSADSTFGGLPSISVAACSDTPYVVTNRVWHLRRPSPFCRPFRSQRPKDLLAIA